MENEKYIGLNALQIFLDILKTLFAEKKDLNNKANTSDLASHTSNKSNPHDVTAPQLGLSSETWTFTLNDGSTVTKTVVVMQ